MPFKEMIGDKIFYTCDACGIKFQFGRNVYEGRYVPEIERMLCNGCAPPRWGGGGETLELLKRRFGKSGG